MTEKERMLSGMLYCAADEQLQREMLRARELVFRYNNTKPGAAEERDALLRELLGAAGKEVMIEPPFHCDYGSNIKIGDYFFANYGCIILDVCRVTIGDDVLFGPRVSLCAAGHPLDAEVRSTGLEFGRPITIGSRVWIGAHTVVNPGVTIGDGAVIGSGSVVTKDIPPNVVAAGVPCRVLREITPQDARFWEERRKHDLGK